MKNLHNKVGEMEFDGLVTDIIPDVQVSGGIIAAPGTETTYKRGTVFTKSTADNKLYILGTTADAGDTLTPDCILCDSVDVETDDVTTAGCFDPAKVSLADSYTLTEADKDKLRERGIVFKAAAAAN